ncbi:tRNA modification GTPase TrmE [Rhizobium sp. Root1203]|uniref:tRNA uridine-5-carboxymethylaminomethyl(34) synthesis GTPase MnmE n=1 Tax=Rhizobium sp. Root1203 TaxID=1736427 RepID=UPI00070DEDE8|nr:tRNA uridine-5-carboxymethylaminomethyl(34) synthesis GTPase MnmE [Rhizobium sp. Root1203]KQV20516.1 tRNA modification GTPase TrmE [Rhizobium sp. Root1203]
MFDHNHTIYALSSGAVPAGVAVVRLSGPAVRDVANRMIGDVLTPRHAHLRPIRTRNGLILDSALVLFFPAPHSFTGEDVLELHLHGGRAVVEALYAELGSFPDLRQAMAGEFSRRAFENGKLDLVEIEGLADLIAAETEMQRRLAVEHSSGGLSAIYSSWAERLTRGRALIEAELDFPDEDDVPGSVSDQVWADMSRLAEEIEAHLGQSAQGEIIRDGFKIVIAGEPNAGKSSLMNALVRRDVAIVTEFAGTTRDVLSTDLNIDGFLVKLFDTAGLRETNEFVEREGIRRARIAIGEADLVLYLEDTSYQPEAATVPAGALCIGTKSDLPRKSAREYVLTVSTETGTGLDELRALISGQLRAKVNPQSMAIPTRARHTDSLSLCLDAVRSALTGVDHGLDVRAEELRVAADALGRVTGRVDVENLLDVIFGEFCIGK